jgi:hypothetical protein
MVSSVDLLGLDDNELAEQLVQIAQAARKLVEQGDLVELANLLTAVREAGNDAVGGRLALLEVSEAFLRALARSDLGKTEVALRRFAIAQADAGASFLSPLADGGSICVEELAALGEAGRELVDVGVLRALDRERFDLRPSLRSLARDLVEPAAFRTWRRVTTARTMAALGKMTSEQAAGYLASEFGVTQRQAELHLQRAPLMAGTLAHQAPVPVRHRTNLRVLYQRSMGESLRSDEMVITRDAVPDQADASRDPTVATVASQQDRAWS